MNDAHQALRAKMAQDPEGDASATVVLAEGLTAPQVELLLQPGGLELSRAEAKVPVGDKGAVYTISLGGLELAVRDGSPGQRLERTAENWRAQYVESAHRTAGAEAREYEGAASGRMRYFKLEIVGRVASIGALLDRPSVAAIFLDAGSDKAQAHRELARQVVQMKSGAPPAPSASRSRTGRPAGATLNSFSSGDPVVDAALAEFEQATGSSSGGAATAAWSPLPLLGTNANPCPRVPLKAEAGRCGEPPPRPRPRPTPVPTTPPTPTPPPAPPPAGSRLSCNSAGAPEMCPNDLAFTPQPATGGFHSWGAAIQNIVGGWYLVPTCRWVFDPELHEDVYVCDYFWIFVESRTNGATISRIRWGTQLFSSGVGPLRVSTAAFKASGLPVCSTLHTGGASPCNPVQSDVTYVPGSGYEDKIILPNPNCRLIVRTGTAADRSAGCFVPDAWSSSLPSAYLDTTAFDGATPYVASIGTPRGNSLVEGTLYEQRIRFWAPGNNNVLGQEARLNAAITTKEPLAPTCLGGLAADTFCFFNVDQVTLARDVFR